ncbi:hypothetical protein PoB_003008300 [Plakobranchus ocellatus]|uniref:Uncharacterized protein n=1 Tax=Plakobranchus ocellatus TaxID=259542 RepID=A0AAV4A8K4_9GAST|nr:hypothetical protein PoB_003008300 [Plakobranchus ocellatus]
MLGHLISIFIPSLTDSKVFTSTSATSLSSPLCNTNHRPPTTLLISSQRRMWWQDTNLHRKDLTDFRASRAIQALQRPSCRTDGQDSNSN